MSQNSKAPAAKADVKKIVSDSLKKFWEEAWDSALEPIFGRILGDIKGIKGDIKGIKGDIEELKFGQKSIKR